MLGIYWTLFTTSLALQFQYRAEMIIWLMGLVMQPVIYLAVWIAVAGSQGGAVGGYTRGDFAAYFLVMMLVHHLTFTWNMFCVRVPGTNRGVFTVAAAAATSPASGCGRKHRL